MEIASTKARFYGQMIKLETPPSFSASHSKYSILTKFHFRLERWLKISPSSLTIGSKFLVKTAGNLDTDFNAVNKVTYNFLGTKSAAVVMILVNHHILAIAMMMVTSIETVVVAAVKLTCTEDLVTTLHYLILITPDEAANPVSIL